MSKYGRFFNFKPTDIETSADTLCNWILNYKESITDTFSVTHSYEESIVFQMTNISGSYTISPALRSLIQEDHRGLYESVYNVVEADSLSVIYSTEIDIMSTFLMVSNIDYSLVANDGTSIPDRANQGGQITPVKSYSDINLK